MCILYDFRSLSIVSSAINSFGNSIHKHTYKIRLEKKNIITETKRKCAETQWKSRHQAKFRRKNLIPRLHFVECVFFFFILIAYGVNIHKCLDETMWHLRSIQRLQHNSNSRFTFSSKTMSLNLKSNTHSSFWTELFYLWKCRCFTRMEWKLIELETLVMTIL